MNPLTKTSKIFSSVALGGLLVLTSGCLTREEQENIVADNLGQGVDFATYDVNSFPLNQTVCGPFGGDENSTTPTTPQNGIKAKLFYKTSTMPTYASAKDYVEKTQASGKNIFFRDLFVPTRMFDTGFASQTTDVLKDDAGNKLIEYFGLKMETVVRLRDVDEEGLYEFALLSDDGSTMKIKNPDETWSTIINNDGDHSTRMGCSSTTVKMNRRTRLEVELQYYQGPRYHIANVLLWRKVAAETDAGKDSLCGKSGNEYYFDPAKNSEPKAPYNELLARGWKPLDAGNYFIPASDISYNTNYNPCVNDGQDPVISNFRIDEVILTDVWLTWQTDIPATSQIMITDTSTGSSKLTTSDNILRTSHQIRIGSLKPQTTYKVKAVSISDTLGHVISQEVEFTTP